MLKFMASKKTPATRKTARVGWNNRTQIVTMPLGFRFPDAVREVFIHREGESVILTPRPSNGSGFFSSGLQASADIMEDTERMLVQVRSI